MNFLALNIYALVSIGCAVCVLAMGIVVYGKNPRNRTNVLFMVLCLTIAAMGFVEFLYRQAPTMERAMFWLNLGMPWALAVAVVLHFVLSFTESERALSRGITYVLIYAPALFFTIAGLLTEQFRGEPERMLWGWHFRVHSSPLYHMANAWAGIVAVLVVSLTLRHYIATPDPVKRKRSKYVVVAFVIAAPIIYGTEVVFPLIGIPFPRLTMPSFALVCALVGYGMWRHKLFGLTPAAATESIINTMSDGLLLVGMDKKIKLANHAVQQMLEYGQEELLEQPIDIVFAPREDDRDDLFAKGTGFRGLIKTVIKGDVEAGFVTKSGRAIPVSLSGSLIRDTDNDLLGIVCIARDITERRRSRESLHLSEERYKLLVEHAPLGIISVDTEGKIVDVNPKLVELLGSPSQEATLAINMLTFPPLVEAGIAADVRRCLDSPRQFVAEHPYTAKWGKELYLRYYLTSRCDSSGAVVGIQAIVEDITEARRIAEALETAKEQLEERVKERTAELSATNEKLRTEIAERMEAQRLLADEKEQLDVTLRSIADGVITVDGAGHIVLINRVAQTLTGCSAREALGQALASVFVALDPHSGEASQDITRTAVDTGALVEDDRPVTLRDKDGRERLVSQSAAPIRDSEGKVTGAVLVFGDVTEKRKLEEELFRARKLESVGVLAGGIAHDFNNILTGIITNLFVAKTQIDKNSEAYVLVSETEKAAFKASSLTNQLLAFSKQGTPIKIVASLREIIEGSVGFFLSGSNVDYRLEIADDLWKVEIDRGQIDQVLQNVIRNADEAMPDGGTITIAAENVALNSPGAMPLEPGNYVKVAVQDEGHGIAEEDLDRIFDPYFSRKQESAGLGLAAAYAIIQKHDGHISISSKLNQGTSVAIYLPACEEEKEAQEEPPAKTKVSSGEARGRVLLMDDEEIIRSAGCKLLKSLGYDVESCSDGTEALTLYDDAKKNNKPFDAVILDLTVAGGMGGREAMKKLLEADPHAKGIVSSGYSTDQVLSRYGDYGFRGVIAKPYNIIELKDTIQSVIENASAGG